MIQSLVRVWPEIKKHRRNFILVVVFGVLTSAPRTVIPVLFNKLIEAWNTGDHKTAMLVPPILTLIWIFGSITRYFHLFIMKYTAEIISVNWRRQLMDKYLSLNLSFFQDFEKGSGGLISRMLNDIIVIQVGIQRVADIVREPITIIGITSYMLYSEWRLTLFIVVTLPIASLGLRRIARSLRKYGRQSQEIMEDLTRTLKESLDGTRIVQSFGLESEMHKKFNAQADSFLANRKKIISREEAAGPISESLMMVFAAMLLVYIGFLVFSKEFTTANFMSFLASAVILQDSVKKLQDGYIRLQQASVGLDRLQAILDSHPTVSTPENPVAFPVNWQTIEFRNVSFAYKEEYVLRNINLKVRRSENIALVGSSGSGKSTLVNLLQRFFDPSEGEVLIDGISIDKFSLWDLRKHIALVTQDVFLFNDTIEHNIQMGNLEANRAKIEEAAQLANAHKFIMNTPKQYLTSVGDFGNRMSGGEKQRLSIARAILKDAPILVLDEATSALDSESELEVQKGLNKLLEGRTAFIIAHRLSTIAKANRILVLKKGEIIEDGSHDELLDHKGEYFKFHQLQFQL
jgi:subfamily B ATP-binding cassette protein MsbA